MDSISSIVEVCTYPWVVEYFHDVNTNTYRQMYPHMNYVISLPLAPSQALIQTLLFDRAAAATEMGLL